MTGSQTHQDRFGFAITTAIAAAAEKYQEGVDLYMSGNAGGEAALRAAMEADPQFALPYGALIALLRDTGRHEEAKSEAQTARTLAEGLPKREKQHIEVLAVMADGDGPRSFELMREHLAEFPRDALILLRADRYIFYSGGENRQQKQLDLLAAFTGDYGDDWWFPGQYGFALGECGRYDEARQMAERSLELNPRNVWAAHTLAHIFADTKDDEQGAAFLGPWLADFDSRAPMYGHTAWHLTLFELGVGHHRRAMEIYDEGVSPAVCKHRSTLNNSASLLWRCMVYGYAPSADQWAALQGLAGGVAENARGEWDDMNAALALAGAGNESGKNRLVDGLRKLAEGGKASAAEVALPLVEGAWAFARGDYDAAIRHMEPAIAGIESVGGSNAQHEVYWDALIEAYLRTDRFAEAEALQRKRLEPMATARDLFRLGRAQIGGGKAEEAVSNLNRAVERWQGADEGSPEIGAIRDTMKDLVPAH